MTGERVSILYRQGKSLLFVENSHLLGSTMKHLEWKDHGRCWYRALVASLVFHARCGILGAVFLMSSALFDIAHGQGVKDLFKCEMCGKRLGEDCCCIEPTEDDDCASAKAALRNAIARSSTGHVGGYSSRKDVDGMSCTQAKMTAAFWTGWKSAADRKWEEEQMAKREESRNAEQQRRLKAEQEAIESRQTAIGKILQSIAKGVKAKSISERGSQIVATIAKELGIPVSKSGLGLGGDGISTAMNNVEANVGDAFYPIPDYIRSNIGKKVESLLKGEALASTEGGMDGNTTLAPGRGAASVSMPSVDLNRFHVSWKIRRPGASPIDVDRYEEKGGVVFSDLSIMDSQSSEKTIETIKRCMDATDPPREGMSITEPFKALYVTYDSPFGDRWYWDAESSTWKFPKVSVLKQYIIGQTESSPPQFTEPNGPAPPIDGRVVVNEWLGRLSKNKNALSRMRTYREQLHSVERQLLEYQRILDALPIKGH